MFGGHHPLVRSLATASRGRRVRPSVVAARQERHDQLWMSKFQQLQEWIRQANHEAPKPRQNDWISNPPDSSLRCWLENNRRHYQRKLAGESTVLSNERQRLLESLEIPLVPRDEWWEKRFTDLQFFLEKHGCFPYESQVELEPEETRLLYWCRKQKRDYQQWRNGENSSMTPERAKRLKKLGFDWDADVYWRKNYDDLKEYRQQHGDCLVPIDYVANPGLAKWVSDQRYQYRNTQQGKKRTALTDQRIKLLNKLDFEWDAFDAMWRRKYLEYKEHVRINGRGSLPSHRSNRQLRSWVDYQRKLYRKYVEGEKSTMTEERKELLDRLGLPV